MKGMRFQWVGSLFEILKEQLLGQFIIKNLSKNQKTMLSYKELMSLYEKGIVKFEAEKDPYEMMRRREGEKYSFDKLGSIAVHRKPKLLFDVIEIDHTTLDLFVVDDENGLPLGRPNLTSVFDKATGAIAGIYVAFHAPSYVSVMKALSHSMSPKS